MSLPCTIGLKFYGNELNLFGYSDADWAGDLDSRRYTTGYVVYAAGLEDQSHYNSNYKQL